LIRVRVVLENTTCPKGHKHILETVQEKKTKTTTTTPQRIR
jgi:hypothetical protein